MTTTAAPPDPLQAPWAYGAGEIASALGTDLERGLDGRDASARLAEVGPNELERPETPAYLTIALRQVADPLVALLVAAAAVSAAIGEGIEAAAIAAIVVLNAGFGFWQEVGAERAVLALQRSLEITARVLRGGTEVEVPARELVPGDVVLLREGDRVPADARLAETLGLEIDESLLTGESLPVSKSVEAVDAATPLADRPGMAFGGTAVTRGGAAAVVVATGAATEQGQIAALMAGAKAPPTPLQRRLGRVALLMVGLGIAITVGLTGAMLLRGETLEEAFLVGVSVAVAAVPEGLSATVTIALALGAREMARRGAVVRTLSAIETIGEATVVCTDKTGTLTENRLRVRRVEPAQGLDEAGLLAAARSAAEGDLDPIDRALTRAADEAGAGALGNVVRAIPFVAERKRSAVVVAHPEGLRSVVKGAPEVVLERIAPEHGEEAARLLAVAEAWAASGLRVLALAARHLPPGVEHDDAALEHGLHPLGLVGLADPLRPTAATSIAQARELGLRVKMLTGDHPLTAAAIAGELGLAGEDVHARFTPADKLALVEALQAQGEVVAVTGDGVNDAPALRRGDVGVAMGRDGTEAAREASSLVLTDDDFATIVAAVREGRRIAGNVRAFLAFLLSANLGEVVLFAVAIVAGLGAPMTVVQVLIVNLLTDGPPAIALARDPAGARAARPGGVHLERRHVVALVVVGLTVGLAALAAFVVVRELDAAAAGTAAFATVALAELVFVFSCRSDVDPPWRLPRNHHLEWAVLASLVVVLTAVYTPFLHDPLGTEPLSAWQLGVVAALALVPAAMAETMKALGRRASGGQG